jgi:hypothetical protein
VSPRKLWYAVAAADRRGDKGIKIGEGTFANVYKGECAAGSSDHS